MQCLRKLSKTVLMRSFGGYDKTHINTILMDIIRQHPSTNQYSVHPTCKFKKIGLDSLDIVEILCDAEDALNIRIPEDVAETIDSLPSAIEAFYKYGNTHYTYAYALYYIM